MQFTDGITVAEARTYRDDTPAEPYSSPAFHAVLRTALKGRRGVYTAHDVAFVDFICDAALRQVNLQKRSASGLEEAYLLLVEKARKLEGKTVHASDNSSSIKIIHCKTTKIKRYSCQLVAVVVAVVVVAFFPCVPDSLYSA